MTGMAEISLKEIFKRIYMENRHFRLFEVRRSRKIKGLRAFLICAEIINQAGKEKLWKWRMAMSVKTHKNTAKVDCRWVIGLLFAEGTAYVTGIENYPEKCFYWEQGKEPLYSREQ